MDIEMVKLLSYTNCLFVALLCLALCLRHYFHHGKKVKSYFVVWILFFVDSALCWVYSLIYLANARFMVATYPVFILLMIYVIILLYHCTWLITNLDAKKHFRIMLHYLPPIAVVLVIYIWTLYIPDDVKMKVLSERQLITAYSVEATLYQLLPLSYCFYHLFYFFVVISRLSNYKRQIVDYSADVQHTSLGWMYIWLITGCSIFPIPIVTVYSSYLPFGGWLLGIYFLVPLVVYVLSTYNFLAGNYVTVETEQPDADETQLTGVIDRKAFEQYIRKKKPYLNPNLRITDMALDLCTNRTYLSSFINKEYNMSFSSYVNRCRLKELDYLRFHPDKVQELTKDEILQRVGFSSYRNYARVKNALT